MSSCIKDSYDYEVVQKLGKWGIVKMKTEFFLKKSIKSLEKCEKCAKVKGELVNSESRGKIKK